VTNCDTIIFPNYVIKKYRELDRLFAKWDLSIINSISYVFVVVHGDNTSDKTLDLQIKRHQNSDFDALD